MLTLCLAYTNKSSLQLYLKITPNQQLNESMDWLHMHVSVFLNLQDLDCVTDTNELPCSFWFVSRIKKLLVLSGTHPLVAPGRLNKPETSRWVCILVALSWLNPTLHSNICALLPSVLVWNSRPRLLCFTSMCVCGERCRLAAVSSSPGGSCICHIPLHPLNTRPFPFITIKRTLSQRHTPTADLLFETKTLVLWAFFASSLLVESLSFKWFLFHVVRFVTLHLLLVHAPLVSRSQEAPLTTLRTDWRCTRGEIYQLSVTGPTPAYLKNKDLVFLKIEMLHVLLLPVKRLLSHICIKSTI